MTDPKTTHIHVGILTGPVFAIPFDGPLRAFVSMVRAQGFVETEQLHVPYHAVSFIGIPSTEAPAARVFHLVPKE